MSLESIFGIAGSALSAESERITLIAQNLANANSVQTAQGGPYQRRVAVFEPIQMGEGNNAGTGVKLAAVLRDQAAPRRVYDPSSPLADASGMVQEPAVNPIFEMVDMMQAARAYQANLSVVETARSAALNTLNLLK